VCRSRGLDERGHMFGKRLSEYLGFQKAFLVLT
jgi:hypothetical protein